MFDVLTIAAVCDELSDRVVGGRIQKVIQLDDLSYGLEVYHERARRILVARASSQHPGLYLSDSRLSADPDHVSPLLLLLRKYARGGIIVAVEQPPLERIVRLSIAKHFYPDNRDDDEPGDDDAAELVYTHLIVELMGRHSNVILVDDEDMIMDSAKRVTPEMSRVRPILPHRTYQNPPPQEKQDPRSITPEAMSTIISDGEGKTKVTQHLVRALNGFSPQMARDVVFRAFGTIDVALRDLEEQDDSATRLSESVLALVHLLERAEWEPSVYLEDDEVRAFAPIRLGYLEERCEREAHETISSAIARALAAGGVKSTERHAQRRASLVADISNSVERSAARVRSLEEQIARAEKGDELRIKGDLIYAYLWKITPGDSELDADGTIISLDPELSASDNAQRYFERYQRLKHASEHLPARLKRARAELDYLEQLRTQAEQADGIEQIEQLRREFTAHEAQRASDANDQRKKKGAKQPQPKKPDIWRNERFDTIYVGRNGPQNERVTFELAGPTDTWLHARGLPGSHVVVRWAGEPEDDVLEQAAAVAAWYSSGRESTSVEVDATDCRYVRKMRGAGPGMVTYRNERSLNVRPRRPEDVGFSRDGDDRT